MLSFKKKLAQAFKAHSVAPERCLLRLLKKNSPAAEFTLFHFRDDDKEHVGTTLHSDSTSTRRKVK